MFTARYVLNLFITVRYIILHMYYKYMNEVILFVQHDNMTLEVSIFRQLMAP